MARKVPRTFTVSEVRDVVSVIVNDDETTDVIEQVILTNLDTNEVVSNQRIRTSIPTVDAWSIIQEASGR